jgi:hypothetical protein
VQGVEEKWISRLNLAMTRDYGVRTPPHRINGPELPERYGRISIPISYSRPARAIFSRRKAERFVVMLIGDGGHARLWEPFWKADVMCRVC